MPQKNNLGFTLIEVIIYLALFSIIIGGGMTGVYQIIQASNATMEKTIIEQEGNFLLRKINFALNGVDSASVNATISAFELAGGNLKLDGAQLNSENIKVTSDLLFDWQPASKTLKTSFKVNDQAFSMTKYLRK